MTIRRLNSSDADFPAVFAELTAEDAAHDEQVETTVDAVLADIRQRGDQALLEYTARFDRIDATAVAELEVSSQRMQTALQEIPDDLRAALETAAQRIRDYAQRQKLESWSFEDGQGNQLGTRVTPLDRVGLYVPGGKASYPSSVLMNAIPAKVAGVGEIIMVAPAPGGQINPVVLAAACIAQVDRVFTIGGAQAVAALAYGTQTIPQVDKIVGPGNAYVAAAKRKVFGVVGIDMVAGPSEILVIEDGGGNPEWTAMDLFSQAEHDEDARAILLSPDANFLDAVAEAINRMLPDLDRSEIARKALASRGALILVNSLDEAASLSNSIAPEHLELALDDPEALLEKISHAGAIFLGRYTPEALGDYCAGPNHVLPTARSARYASPLGVYDFQKRSSIIRCTVQGAAALAEVAGTLADAEGLQAHAASARYRSRK